MVEARKGDWCQTFTGKAVYPIDMRVEDIDMLDIAHSLALQCRFTGHCRVFYSVAEHSLHVYDALRESTKAGYSQSTEEWNALRWALMHDAAEAYMTDIPRPVKRSITGWREVEQHIEETIAKRFGLVLPIPDVVKHFDSVLLATEARDLMAPPPQTWVAMPDPLRHCIRPLPWQVAEARFLHQAAVLDLVKFTSEEHDFRNPPGDELDFSVVTVCGRPVAIGEYIWDTSGLRPGEALWRMRAALPRDYDVADGYGGGGNGHYSYDVVPRTDR